jgi:hypothetical protein
MIGFRCYVFPFSLFVFTFVVLRPAASLRLCVSLLSVLDAGHPLGGVMEQVTGGRYTGRSMCGERRKRRTSEGLGDEEGIEYPNDGDLGDCGLRNPPGITSVCTMVVSLCFCLLPRSGGIFVYIRRRRPPR